jgi:hypothetical protein
MIHANASRFAVLYLRWSLGLTFLSACADRFGLWGPPGSKYAVWGDWAHFVAYSATLNWFLPGGLQITHSLRCDSRRGFIRFHAHFRAVSSSRCIRECRAARAVRACNDVFTRYQGTAEFLRLCGFGRGMVAGMHGRQSVAFG